MSDNVSPILAPNRESAVEHLGLLFGRALHGRIEITAIYHDKEARRGPRTRFFDVGDLDEAADFALEVNHDAGWNVYVGAALRHDGVFPGKAADDDDFLEAYALFVDTDTTAELNSAWDAYRKAGLSPPFTVVTGRTPETRAQFWWPLEDPIRDADTQRSALRGLAAALGSDPRTCTAKQLMRLAGTLNWPKSGKEGRALERCELVPNPKAARGFTLDQIQRWFPPLSRAESREVTTDVVIAPVGALGLDERVMDGRELYGFRLARAHLHEFIGTTGSAPSPDELYKEAAPVFFAKTDQTRPGRGPEFFKTMCVSTVRAFHAGQIPFARTLDEAVQTYAARNAPGVPREAVAALDEVQAVTKSAFCLTDWTADRYAGAAPPIEWLCDGTVPLGIPVLFASMGGLGKSFMALDLALSIAVGVVSGVSGRNILGGAVVQRGTAVVLSAEDGKDSIHRRLEQIDPQRHRLSAPGNLIVVPMPECGGPRPLIGHDGKTFVVTEAFDDLCAQLRQIPDLRVVIIDPLQAFVSSDVNADPAAAQFMWSTFARLCAETGCTLICAHHMRKEGSAKINTPEEAREAIRGTTALVDGARLAYALWRTETDRARELCARLDTEYAADKIAMGAVVKANDQACRDLQIYVRQSERAPDRPDPPRRRPGSRRAGVGHHGEGNPQQDRRGVPGRPRGAR